MESTDNSLNWSKLVLSSGLDIPKEMTDLLRKSQALYVETKYEESLAILQTCYGRWGRNRHILAALAEVSSKLDRIEQSLEYELELVQMDPNSPQGFFGLGVTYMELASLKEARAAFETALRLDPGYWKAMCNLGALCNDPCQAVAWLRESAEIEELDIVTRNPEDTSTKTAIETWSRIASDPSFDLASHRVFWATELSQKHDWRHMQREIALAREMTLTDELKGAAFSLESEMYRQTGRLRESVDALRKCTELRPAWPAGWNTLCARLYLLAREPSTSPDEALQLLVEAVKVGERGIRAGDYSMVRRNVALAYLALGQIPEGARAAKISLDMAQLQLESGPAGPPQCPGCATEGKDPDACRDCLARSQGVLNELKSTLRGVDYMR